MSAYHFKYFQNIQFKNHGIAPTPPDLPTLKAYPTPGVGGRFGIFSLKWRERMNLKVPGATLPLGCAILSTRARTVRGGLVQPPLGELGLKWENSTGLFHFAVILKMKMYINLAPDREHLINTNENYFSRCHIPVVIMGETGCGKTRLIRFMCQLLAAKKPKDADVKNMILMKVGLGLYKR